MANTKNTETKKNVTKKAVAKKTTAVATVKTPAKVEEKKVETKKVNANKLNITMPEVEAMLKDAGIMFKPNNCEYRILAGGSSLHVKKSAFVLYSTDADFANVSKVKAADLELKEHGNAQDGKRPNFVRFTTIDTLKSVIKAMAPKVATA